VHPCLTVSSHCQAGNYAHVKFFNHRLFSSEDEDEEEEKEEEVEKEEKGKEEDKLSMYTQI
jgi:hypothetical protein